MNYSRVRLHPINPAEAVLAMFFDKRLTPEKEWQLDVPSTTKNARLYRTYGTNVSWDTAEPAKPAATLTWRGEIDVSKYNGMFFQAAIGKDVTLRLSAVVSGKRQLISQTRGANLNDDYMGRFEGNRLEEIRIELIPDTSAPGGMHTYYLGVYHDRRLQDLLDYENADVHPRDWPDFIKPETEWGELKPEIGIHFDAGELDELRRKIAAPPYKRFADLLREQTRAWLSLDPEKDIRQFLRCGDSPYGYSARARDRGLPLWGRMEQCAFFGLLDRDVKMVRMAARCAIAAAHVRHWSEGIAEHAFPGSSCNWRSFMQNVLVHSMANTLDWIGAVFTWPAIEVLCHSLFFKGLAPIQHDFARYEYIYHMNQAVGFSTGRIAGLLALRKHWPRVDWMMEQAHKDLDETAHCIIHQDGGYGEGPGYYGGVMYYMLQAYFLLARFRKTRAEKLVPPGVLRGTDYFGVFVSTTRKASKLMLSDNILPELAPDWLALFASLTGDARWKGLLADSLESCTAEKIGHVINLVWLTTSVRTLIYGPSDLSERISCVPVFQIHESSGHATSCRPTQHGSVRLHLSGASASEGHSHQDKGAIILEAFGEDILIDRGMLPYTEPLTSLFKLARMHNLTVPFRPDGTPMEQINPCPAPITPRGSGNEQNLHLTIDTSAAWPKPVTKMIRTIRSDRPLEWIVTDEAEFAEPMAVAMHLHCYAPIQAAKGSATFQSRKSRLRVSWDWNGEVTCAREDLYDYSHRPVYHFILKHVPLLNQKLITKFELSPI